MVHSDAIKFPADATPGRHAHVNTFLRPIGQAVEFRGRLMTRDRVGAATQYGGPDQSVAGRSAAERCVHVAVESLPSPIMGSASDQ